MERHEQALWERVELGVRQQPGPDPERLAAIRARMDTQRRVDRRNLCVAAAMTAALGSTAAAALWVQSERGAEHTTDEQAGPDAEKIDAAAPDAPIEPAIQSAPTEPEDHGEDASNPVIFCE